MEEENSGEEDLFEEARSNAGKITKGELSKRIKEIKNDPEFEDEFKVLKEYFELIEKEAELKNSIKELELDLDKKLFSKYKSLTEDEIKTLVVEDKWMVSLHNSVKSEMERISQRLEGRIKELAERYENPLPKLINEVEELSKKVDNHLEKMGFKW